MPSLESFFLSAKQIGNSATNLYSPKNMSSKVIFVVVMLSVLLQVGEAIFCAPNERIDGCGKKCEPSCRHPDPACTWEACQPEDIDCRCKKGLYRDNTGSCVEEIKCPLDK